MIKEFVKVALNVNDEGYLMDFSQWTKEIGEEIAREHNITLTDEHWEVIDYIQQQVANNKPLSIRGIKHSANLAKFHFVIGG